MATQSPTDFQAVLRQRAQELADQIGVQDEAAAEALYEGLRTTALESWKNGLSAGRKRAFAKSATAQRSNRSPR